MPFAPTSPVTGGPQTGFTSPTYTLVADSPPDINAKQYYVSAIGGTQAGVSIHSAAMPFTVSMFKPKVYRALGTPNPSTGVVNNVPVNNWKTIVRKGAIPLAGQPATKPIILTLTQEVPAGVEAASPAELRAAYSLLFGVAFGNSAALSDTVIQGVI